MLPPHIKRQKNINNPILTSVTGHKLDAKGSIRLDVKWDNRIFLTNFIICNNFPHEAIIGANFLRSNKILLDVANERLVYSAKPGRGTSISRNINRSYKENVTINKISDGIVSQSFEPYVSLQRGRDITINAFSYSVQYRKNEVNINNKWIESAKIKIGDMQQYRSKEIKEMVELWKQVGNPNAVQAQPMLLSDSASLNLIDNENKEKYYGFAIRKVKIPNRTMQRIQISQMIETVDSKSKIWFAIPSKEIPENFLCKEQIISYDTGEGFIWVTNNHENDTITIKKGTCLVQIQIISENYLNK